MASRGETDGPGDRPERRSTWSPFTRLPYEIVVAVVGCLCLRDTAAAAASGARLAVAAREALDKRLVSMLVAAGIDPHDNGGGGDVLAHYAALHNAIAYDDPVTVAAVLRAGVIASLDAPMPLIEVVSPWVPSVAAVFALTGDHHVCAAPPPSPARFMTCRMPSRDGNVPYQLDDDLGAARVSAVFLPRGPIQQTPLVKAVRCASRRVVRTLLSAGARPYPSPETLLACAMDRLVDDAVLVVRRRHVSVGARVDDLWDAPQCRTIDGPGIVGDLLVAFARTPPPLGPLDVNPLSCLRGTLYWAKKAYPWNQLEEPTDGPLSRFARALSALLAAGYSPDERVSLIPQDRDMYGHLADGTGSACGDPTTRCADDALADPFKRRRKVVDITEREAAAATRADCEHSRRASPYASERIFSLGLVAICAAYDAIPRSYDSNGPL